MLKIFVKCCVIVCVILSAFFMFPKKTEKKLIKEYKKQYYVQVISEKKQEEIELETYLIGVVASEMSYAFEMEALKAQAIASRTYVLQRGLQVDATTNTQVYKSEHQLKEIYEEDYDAMYAKIKKAIDDTKGIVLKYDNEYISALFYACNNGYSNDCSWYFSGEKPYLKSVESAWDLQYEGCKSMVEKSKAEVLKALNVNALDFIQYTYYENGYVKNIQIQQKVFTGREVREALQLRSSCFRFDVQDDIVNIYCEGYGHGVGMSQHGANGMAKEGYTYEEILKHYYTGVTLQSIE